nr:Arc family DNA-binding protein [Paracoccus saliphilus]
MATVGRGAEQYTVRFPDGLRDRIKAAADANNRSMNAEIVATLEEKYPAPAVHEVRMSKIVEVVSRIQGAKDFAEQQDLVAEANEWLHSLDQSLTLRLLGEPDEKGLKNVHFSVAGRS